MGVLNTVRSGLNVLFTPVLYGVVASLALQLSTWEKGDRTQDKLADTQNQQNAVFKESGPETFDFLVIGGGNAGSLVANRLSEFYSVLLVEAGGEPNPLVYVPGLSRNLASRQEVDWTHKTVAQRRACLLSQFKRATWSAGKGLGGSGNLGMGVSMRGHERDYDNWGKLVEDESWSYKHLKRYFQRHENFVGNTTDAEAHIQGGEMTIQLPDYRPLAQEFVWAGKELGYSNLDLNGRFTEGFDEIYSPCKKGEKLTSYKVFVEPIKRREKLAIRKFATVTKILLRKNDNSAYGIEYERHGKKYTAYATREVILSAGAIGSPKILLHSGIGPKRHLEDMGIKPVVTLPVGRNLQDHVSVPLGPFFIKDPLSFDFDRDVTAKSFFEYGTFGTGPVTTTGYSAHAFIASSFAKLRNEKDWPDLQLLMHGVSCHSNYAGDMAHAFGLNEASLKQYYKHCQGRNSFHIVVSLARPYARGEVRLASRTPTDPIIIDPKYLEDPWDFDVKTLVEGLKKAVEIVEGTKKFQGLAGHFTSEVLPGCEKVKFRSDEYWECYVRQYAVSMHNPVGTCTMGPVGSPHTVVDNKLRVVNVPGLRVIDASVMPSIVIGGTQQATLAVAEKAAESVLEYWSKNKSPPQIVKPNNSKEQIYGASSEIISAVPAALQTTPRPTMPPTTTTQSSLLQAFTISPETSKTWQNTLDQLSQFSKQIQQTLQVPTQASVDSSAAAQTAAQIQTSTVTANPHMNFFQSQSPVTPSVGVSYQTSTSPKSTTPFLYVPIVSLPTQQVQINSHGVKSPTPKVTTYRPPQSSPVNYPQPTTFRPMDHHKYSNVNNSFSLNVPIIKGKYHQPIVHTTPTSVKIYTASSVFDSDATPTPTSFKVIPSYPRKEHQYTKFVPPKPVTTRRTTTTQRTTTTTTQRPTTRRPMFEMVHSQVLPHGYEKFVEIPMTHMEYQVVNEPGTSSIAPTRRQPTTTTRPPPPATRRMVHHPVQVIPAVQMSATALETTTTRYTVPKDRPNFGQTHIQTVPHDFLLSGLEPFSLVDVTTATENPREYTTPRQSTSTQAHYKSLKQSATEQAPIYYVVRKKNKKVDPFSDFTDVSLTKEPSRQTAYHHNQNRNPHNRNNQRPTHYRKPNRPRPQSHPNRRPNPQRHYSMVAQPTSHYFSPQRQQVNHYLTTVEDQQTLGSQQIHSIVPRPHQSSRGSGARNPLDGVLTPALSSTLFEQGVLDQLIPIQK